MSRFAVYLDLNLLDHTFGNDAFSTPSSLYFALCNAAIDPTDTGADISETAYGSYARATVANNSTNFPSATNVGDVGTKVNGVSIEFPEVTSGTDTITHVAILDTATIGAGNILAYGTLTVSKSISTGDKLIFEPDGLTITLT